MPAIVRACLIAAIAVSLIVPVGSEAADERLAEPEVFGFLPYWELGRADTIDLDLLTTLAWFGVEADREGHLIREADDGEPTPGWAGWTSDEFAALRARAQAADVRVVLTVERFSWTVDGRRATKRLLADASARATLVREIVEAISAARANGVNLDFEPLPKKARGDFVLLVRKLRRALDKVGPSLQLTFDLTPDVDSFPLKRLVGDGAADAAVLMGYEYRTRASRVAGSVAPMRDPHGLDVRDSVNRAVSRAPAERVILAMPWYGRAWSTRTAEAGARTRQSDRFIAPSVAFYRVSVLRAAAAGRLYDARQASAWSVYESRACETCPPSPRQLWYDDVDSVRAKVGLARRGGLGGVGIWALGYDGDRTELWSALRYALERRPDTMAPTGSARVADESVLGERDGFEIVGRRVTLELAAVDDPGGSGIAFVRVSTLGKTRDDGSLKRGTTFPAVDAVTVGIPGAEPVDEVFKPVEAVEAGEAATPEPSQETLTGSAAALASDAEPVTIRVQWRDIAGNWSEPQRLRVLLGTGTPIR